jgi:hypothetical protein
VIAYTCINAFWQTSTVLTPCRFAAGKVEERVLRIFSLDITLFSRIFRAPEKLSMTET